MTAATSASILHHSTAFLDDLLSHPDRRHRVLSSALRRIPNPDPALLQTLTLISKTLDNPLSSPSLNSLRSAEKLLLSLPNPNPNLLTSLLLSSLYFLRCRPISAGVALLDLFVLDPAFTRSEIAPRLFEDLFIPHVLPAVRWFSDQRSRILVSGSGKRVSGGDDEEAARSPVFAAMSLLSRMSGGQAAELRESERRYEEVMDENCRVYAEYLKKVLEGSDGDGGDLRPPKLVLMMNEGEAAVEEEKGASGEIAARNGPYNNPMWAEVDQSIEFSGKHRSKGQISNSRALSLYPQRVPPHLLNKKPFKQSTNTAANLVSDAGPALSSVANSDDSSVSDPDIAENTKGSALFQPNKIEDQTKKLTSSESSFSSNTAAMVDSDNFLVYGKQNPPKDFVCPITSHIFSDPVTLETGQTYERKAIQEWLDRGNSTCPITRQKLSSTQLPKTNYVLKRLIASWQEQNPCSTPSRSASPPPKDEPGLNPLRLSPSPTSVISQASADGTIVDLRLAISQLCTSEILDESEMAVLKIERFWRESSSEPETTAALSKPAVINGFVEILFNSVNPQVLGATVFLLSELASKNRFVVQTLTRVDSDVECMVALFKKGLVEAVVLIFLLCPSWESLIEMDMVEALMMTIKRREGTLEMSLNPKTASILLLWQILRGDHRTASVVTGALISGCLIESLVSCLETKLVEERVAVIGILVRCMVEDGNCRNMIADKADLAPVLESFLLVTDTERFEIVRFLYELVKLNRRTFNQQLLHIIKEEGAFSTMHTLLVHLQTAVQDQSPLIAGLLLQLDLLVEPRKMSLYREEAIDALISCLKDSDFPNSQLLAAETILALQGRFSSSGKPLIRAFLLKHAGMNKSYRALMRAEKFGYAAEDSEENLEEEKAADEWEQRMAFALVSHEFGLLFEALADGLKSKNSELFSACLVSATWLIHMLSILPDTGIRGAARVCLFKQYVSILKSSKSVDDKALAMLALRSFLNDPEGLNDLTFHIKDVLKTLRELKRSSVLAYEMLKLLSDGNESSTQDMWNHKELNQVDCSGHGEVSSIVYFKNRIFSGHSDGTIKVWRGSENLLHLVQETHEHTKAVTSLAILQSAEKLYSGSLDKSVKVWAVRDGQIHCVEIYDMKDQIHNLIVANTIACFIPQGSGAKVFSWNGGSKLLNSNKYVRSLALVHGKLYCGCQDSSIQEIDLATGTSATIQLGNRKLLGKATPVYALHVHDGFLYSVSGSLDGGTVKIHSATNYSLVGSLPCMVDVRSIAISTELIYLGSKTGFVDIWSKEKLSRIGSLQTGTNSKVQCMALDDDGEVLVLGTSDGRIQAWGLT